MSDVGMIVTILFLAAQLASGAQSMHPTEIHKTKMGMALTIAGKFSLWIPEMARVTQNGPSSIAPYETYLLSTAHLHVYIAVLPYQTSEADVSGHCTVSRAFDHGDPNAPLFCESNVLSHSLRTKLGTAKWTPAVYKNSRTMNSPEPPPQTAYGHLYVVAIPVKEEGVIVELSSWASGGKNQFYTAGDRELWPMIRDSVLPSLARLNCN